MPRDREGVSQRPLEAARESGLVRPERPLLVLLSGGGDSVCLLDVALGLGAEVTALHVNYGLREGAATDERFCRELCDGLGVPLVVERVRLPEGGNLQDQAREIRYGLAERHAEDDYAAAHTASDQAETVLYRLAVSPGRRALLGMEARRGRLVRPLLSATREEARAYCRARGLDWREDPSNADRRFARARVRHDVLAALEELNPAAERAIAETARLLRDEAEVLDRVTAEALEGLGGGPAVPLAELRSQPAAVARLVLRSLAEMAAGSPRALSRREADAVLALTEAGTHSLDLGGGLRAIAEYGTVRFTREPDAEAPEPVELPVPGSARFGDWEIEARLGEAGDVAVSADSLGGAAIVRSWRDGDRMRPLGLDGTKTLQDLFTDRKVPRGLRRTLPVVEAGGQVVWVAGVAVDERCVAEEPGPATVGLVARRAPSR
ncbi:MAG: tRNA lysidine(34) synthetase TilS [Thermoleophilaceae bacterium]